MRFTTWLSPGLPVDIFRIIADHVGATLGYEVELSVEAKISGPIEPGQDRFATKLTDIGFLCPPPYLWLTSRPEPSIQLVPYAPVYDDDRNMGRPVYFSDIVVADRSPITEADGLEGCRFGFNDAASLSGYHGVLAWLRDRGLDSSFFGSFTSQGGHRTSLQRIVDGELDAAAVDANVWRAWEREDPSRAGTVRSLTAIGPHPVQPVVVRSGLVHLIGPVGETLTDPHLATALTPLGVVGFAPVSHLDYQTVADKVSPTYAR